MVLILLIDFRLFLHKSHVRGWLISDLNAVIRAIDLSAKILAPTSVGLIMSYGSCLLSAIVIAGWNLVSVFVEYGILKAVYNKVPELANKKVRTSCAGEGRATFVIAQSPPP